jgi:nitroreductase
MGSECFECVERVIKERRSHRFYLDKPVEREKLEKMIELAMWAPSAMNRQQWFFVVVGGERLKSLLSVISKSVEHLMPRLERFFGDTPKIIALTKQFFRNLGNAPIAIFAYYTPTGDDYSDVQSVSAAIQNMLLAAHAMGLGTCWMTGPVHVEEEINQYLGVKDKKLVAVVTVGYSAKKPPVPPRREVEKKVVWMID